MRTPPFSKKPDVSPGFQLHPPLLYSLQMRRLTPIQQAVLDNMTGDTVILAGRTLTREDLGYIFSGQQLPRDPELCRLLDIRC